MEGGREGEGVRRWAAGEGDVTGRKEIAFTETKDIPSAGAASSALNLTS